MANITSPTHMQALRDRRGALSNLRATDGPFSPARRTLHRELALEAAAKAGRSLPPDGLDTALGKGGRVRSEEESPSGMKWSLGRWSPRKLESSRPIRDLGVIAGPQRYTRLPSNLSRGASNTGDASGEEGGGADGGFGGGSGPSPRQLRQSTIWGTTRQPKSPEMAWAGIEAIISPSARKTQSGEISNPRSQQLSSSPMSPNTTRGRTLPGSPARPLSSPSLQARQLFSTPHFPPHLPPVKALPPREGLLYVLYDPVRTSQSRRSISPPGAFESSPGPPPPDGRGYFQRSSPGTGVFFPRPSLGLSERDSHPSKSRAKSRLQHSSSFPKRQERFNGFQDSTGVVTSQIAAMLPPGDRHRVVDPFGGQENTHLLPPRYKEHSLSVGARGWAESSQVLSPTRRTAVINLNLPTDMTPPGGLWNGHVGVSKGKKGCIPHTRTQIQMQIEGKSGGEVVSGEGWKAKAESKQKGSTILGRRGIKAAALEMGLAPLSPLKINSAMSEREEFSFSRASEDLVTFSI